MHPIARPLSVLVPSVIAAASIAGSASIAPADATTPTATGGPVPAGGVVAAGEGTCTADVLGWEQLPSKDTIGLAAQDDASYPLVSEVADEFVGNGNYLVGVEWWGLYWNGVPQTPESFRVRIYADDEGLPGEPLYDQVITEFEETTDDPNHYCALLPEAFEKTESATLHLSVQAALSFPPQWGWATALVTGAECSARSTTFGSVEWVPGSDLFGDPNDVSFRLLESEESPVDERSWAAIKSHFGR